MFSLIFFPPRGLNVFVLIRQNILCQMKYLSRVWHLHFFLEFPYGDLIAMRLFGVLPGHVIIQSALCLNGRGEVSVIVSDACHQPEETVA